MNAKYLNECFRYNPESGYLFWKKRPRNHFATEQSMKAHNNRWAGKIAGTKCKDGYIQVMAEGKNRPAHRVIYCMVTGKEPVGKIDHIDHNESNNAWNNLRLASHKDNMRNRRKNKHGIFGIYWHQKQERYFAYIGDGKKTKHLGSFECFFDAACARKSAEIKFGYHENHGI